MKAAIPRLTRAVCIVGLLSLFALLSTSGTAWTQSVPPATAPDAGILPPTIPIFPLPDLVFFPDISRPLHIFEPRYRAMVADALKGDRIIGMVLLRPGFEANYEGRPPVYQIGCAGVIADVEELPDGRYNIVLEGLVKFRITGEDQSRAYRLAHVDAMPELLDAEEKAALHKQRPQLEALLGAFMTGSAPIPPAVPDEDLVNALAQYAELDTLDRQALLERTGARSRAQGLIELLKLPLPRK